VFYSAAAESGDSSCRFSNFHLCSNGVELDGLVYPSSEHAYQASCKFAEADRPHFASGGKLAGFDGMSLFYPEAAAKAKDTVTGKTAYWSKKSMVGIIAKLAQGQPAKAGLVRTSKLDMDSKCAQFKRILLSKYRRHPELKAGLLATGDRYLLEFCKGAKRRELTGNEPERWGGIAEEQSDGRWYVFGDNAMGKLMMAVRDELR
jgi:predicted NAD-dependent protein-ADP-ribosyltransferase YbiA (DUF1768 family)